MIAIAIREEGQTEQGFSATLSFDGGASYPIEIVDPFAAQEQQQWEWYFEEWINFPLSDEVRANAVVERIKAYGISLFQ